MKSIINVITAFLADRFSLYKDQEREDKIVEEIRKGVEFKGTNVWVLVFAIMVASVGLNVNSAAAIIGAMLISPLMGPIMGIGLGAGISDMNLIKKSATSIAVMVAISVLTSWFYFYLSPLNTAQSELLARTTPTIWDVFIGFFGGLAGIVATASKEKGNVIAGVAIATALMPPLCTAGYGLAIGNMNYFFGAFYLFSINAVFICFSTLLIVRFLQFREVSFISPEIKKKANTLIAVFVIAMVIPSVYIARTLVLETLFLKKVDNYISTVFDFPTTEVLKYDCKLDQGNQQLVVSLVGELLDANTISHLKKQLETFDLTEVELVVKQGPKSLKAEDIKSQVLEEFLTRNLDSLQSKEDQINYLKNELLTTQKEELPMNRISKEAGKFDVNIKELCIQKAVYYDQNGQPVDTVHLALTKYSKKPKTKEVKRFEDWLKERLEADSVRVVVE